ncbi:MAG: Cna B-type domain-containing protein [Solobacterium sp.]|nr:Cna B-type domain-containing protein [Solobacterium sp.]
MKKKKNIGIGRNNLRTVLSAALAVLMLTGQAVPYLNITAEEVQTEEPAEGSGQNETVTEEMTAAEEVPQEEEQPAEQETVTEEPVQMEEEAEGTDEEQPAVPEETAGEEGQPEEPAVPAESETRAEETGEETVPAEEPASEEIIEVTPAENTEETPAAEEPEETPIEEVQEEEPADIQEEEEISELDAEGNYWSLDITYFDSTVGGGRTPLKSINWNASDGGRDEQVGRNITVQITYRNTAVDKDYAPGELTLTIPNLMARTDPKDMRLNWNMVMSANDATHTGYDWTFQGDEDDETYVFTNAAEFHKDENFEGTLSITYTIRPQSEYTNRPDTNWIDHDPYLDECVRTHTADLQAVLTDRIEEEDIELTRSNLAPFRYTRTYIHPWQRQQFTLAKDAEKISSYEGLGEHAADYTWVKYTFAAAPYVSTGMDAFDTSVTRLGQSGIQAPHHSYPYIFAHSGVVVDTFPDDCVVLDYRHQTPALHTEQTGEGTTYRIRPADIDKGDYYVYVGYPKSIYNEEADNMHITNHADLYGIYGDRSAEEKLAESEISIDLSDFAFVYTGDLYRVDKYNAEHNYSHNYYWHSDDVYLRTQDILNDYSGNEHTWHVQPYVNYPGYPYDMVIGDDLMYSTGPDGTVTRLEDDDYYFSKLDYFPAWIYNSSGTRIPTNKYDCELWIRRAGNTEYELYKSFRNGATTTGNYYDHYFAFTREDAVVGFYFVIKDLTEGFKPNYLSALRVTTKFIRDDIPARGRLHNFSYLDIYRKVGDQRILDNEPDLDSYATEFTKKEIAAYDMATTGHYHQRGTDYIDWKPYVIPSLQTRLNAGKTLVSPGLVQEVNNKRFAGTFRIAAGYTNTIPFEPDYIDDYRAPEQEKYLVHGYQFYDLLPEGMQLLSSEDEILDNVYLAVAYHGENPYERNVNVSTAETYIYDRNMNLLDYQDFERICKDRTTVKTVNNWNNTGRTYISVVCDLSDYPVFFSNDFNGKTHEESQSMWYGWMLATEYKFSIPYTSVEDFGPNYLNYVYTEPCPEDTSVLLQNPVEKDVLDLNENGSTDDDMKRARAAVNTASAPASLQGLTKLVETRYNSFTTGTAFAGLDQDYRYRLRVSSGSTKVTDLVIYDSVEAYAYTPEGEMAWAAGDNPYWQGNLIGVDTSFAESKGYTVNVYWSAEEQPGRLGEDTGWTLLSEETDLSAVKSLAFEYLDRDGNPVVLPENTSTYVEVRMHSPASEDVTAKAYNGSWVNWTALDEYDHPIMFIEGIASNIVSVSLNEKIELPVRKTWENDRAATRPESAEIALLADGEQIDSVVLSEANGWHSVFTDLWKYNEDGSRIEYSFEELNVPENYSVSYTDDEHYTHISEEPKPGYFHVINTSHMTEINGQKIWENDKEYYRPEKITVHLLRNGTEIASAETDAEHDWKYAFDDQPVYDSEGNKYTYTVTEDVPEGYEADYTYAFNPYGPCTVSFDESKFSTSSFGYLAVYYRLNGQLYRAGYYSGRTFKKEIHLPSSDLYFYWYSTNSTYSGYGYAVTAITPYEGTAFETGRPAAQLPGEVTVTEELPHTPERMAADYQHLLQYNPAETTITNRYVYKELTVQKQWKNDDNITRPASITAVLMRNGEDYAEQELNEANNWTYTFGMLKDKDENGEPYVYTVREKEVPEHYLVSYSDGKETVTEPAEGYNTIINTGMLIELTGKKTWRNDTPEDRPETLTIHLLRNGERYAETTTDAAHDWKFSFEADKYAPDGSEYAYTIEEDVPFGYVPEYDNTNAGKKLDGPCRVTFDRQSSSEAYGTNYRDYLYIYYYDSQNRLRRCGPYGGSNWPTLTFPTMDLYFYWYSDSRNNNYYGFKVDSIEPYSGTVSAWGSTGYSLPGYMVKETDQLPETRHNPYTNYGHDVWHYTATNFTVNNDYVLTQLSGHKTWKNDLPEDRPESITVVLQQNGADYRTMEVTAEDNWEYTFRKLPINDENGNAYQYAVREEPVDHYTVQYTDQRGEFYASDTPKAGYYNIANTSDRLLMHGVKEWEDNGPSGRPESITVNLLRNGEVYKTVETDEAHNWSYVFSGDRYDENGAEYVYEVQENVPEGYTARYSHVGPVTVRFNPSCYSEEDYDGPYDYLVIYYRLGDQWYRTYKFSGQYYGTVNLPTSDLYFYWYTGRDNNNFYGYKVDAITPYDGTSFAPVETTYGLPGGQFIEADDLPESAHYPYESNNRSVTHYRQETEKGDFVITNMSLTTSVYGMKYWRGDTEEDRPESIEVELLQNGTPIDTATVSEDTRWMYEFINLPRVDENNERYTYAVREKNAPENYTVMYGGPGAETGPEPGEHKPFILNIWNRRTIEGTKSWEGDAEKDRPESITVHLLKNGAEYMTAVTDAAHDWKYAFTVPIRDANGADYEYTVREDVPKGYKAVYAYHGPVTVKFNAQCEAERGYDYLIVLYALNGKLYQAGNYTGKNFPSEINLPSEDIYFYWHTDGSDNEYYGYKVDAVEKYEGSDFVQALEVSYLPAANITETTELPESPHDPYLNSTDELLHYANGGPIDILNVKSDEPEYVMPRTGGIGTLPLYVSGTGMIIAAMWLHHLKKKQH